MALSLGTAPAQTQTLVARRVPVCLRGRTGSPCPGSSLKFLPIAFCLGRAGKDWVDFGSAEPHTRTKQRFRVGRWTWQGVPLQLPPGQERLCAHGEPGALIASYPHFSSYLPSGLGEGPWGILGRELASLPKLVHLPLYSINGPWGRFPKGSPDGHGCWSMWRKAQSFTHLARWAALMGRPWPEAELQNPMVPGF